VPARSFVPLGVNCVRTAQPASRLQDRLLLALAQQIQGRRPAMSLWMVRKERKLQRWIELRKCVQHCEEARQLAPPLKLPDRIEKAMLDRSHQQSACLTKNLDERDGRSKSLRNDPRSHTAAITIEQQRGQVVTRSERGGRCSAPSRR
jgi:hypothetical protein